MPQALRLERVRERHESDYELAIGITSSTSHKKHEIISQYS
ncbi:MAG: hypothetical protein V7L29_34480 [Nostoc sp.]